MKESDDYIPQKGRGSFIIKTINSVGKAMSRIKIQSGHEKGRHIPALFKLISLFILIVFTSVCMNKIALMAIAAGVLLCLSFHSGNDILEILKPSLAAAFLAALIFVPAMIMNPAGIENNLTVISKIFLSVIMVSIFNHTTQWNHITLALRKLHIPGIFVFTLDITLKYIVQLGRLIQDLLTAMRLRSVGRNGKKYGSVGGVMGVTFIRGTEMNEQMYEAMRCRGFTDDYKGL